MINDVELSRVTNISRQNLLNLPENNYTIANNNDQENESKENRCFKKDRKISNYIIIPLHLLNFPLMLP